MDKRGDDHTIRSLGDEMTGYHEKACEILTELVNHGFGDIHCRIDTLKSGDTRIKIEAGKEFIFFVKRDYAYKGRDDLI